MKKKFLAAAIGAMLIGGSAMAVELSHGGKGDLLIAPMVMAGGSWQSEIKVINTDLVNSAVAKIVFHHPVNSSELLDFMLYLTPGDVWTGTLVQAADGSVGVNSTDDSAFRVTTNGACPAATGTVLTSANFTGGTVAPTMAYVNIFESKIVTGLGAAPVLKSALIAKYAADCVASAGVITPAQTSNVLTGSVKMSNPLNGNMLALPMTALSNYDNASYLTVGAFTGFAVGTGAAKQTVEDALWTNELVVPYNNAAGQFTFATVTFPTKEAFITPYTLANARTQYAPFVSTPTVSYGIRDEQENALTTQGCTVSPCPADAINTLPNELNVVQIATGNGTNSVSTLFTQGFTKGWVNVTVQPQASTFRSFAGYNNFGQSGAPAIGTYIQWNFVGNTLQGAWNYTPYTMAPGAF